MSDLEREITIQLLRKYNFLKTNREWNVPTFPMQNFQDTTIPLIVAEEGYKEYSTRYGTGQSLERLGERCGFAGSELAILLFERIKRLEQHRTRERDAATLVNAELIQERDAVQGENAEYVRKWIELFQGKGQGSIVSGILKLCNEAIQWRNERDELKKKLQKQDA